MESDKTYEIIDSAIKLAISNQLDLDFAGSGEEDNVVAYWSTKEKPCLWESALSSIDPLSAVLVFNQPEKRSKEDDNEAIATLSYFLNKSPGWLRSFQCGWFNKSNSSSSITGFLIGRTLRNEYMAIVK